MLPLVENAFKHGTEKTIDIPWINIQLHINKNNLTLNISNSKANYQEINNNIPGKIGVENVRKRLELLYPGKHELNFFDEEDCFITVLNLQLTTE
jgi:LytS/YehU family sensor histidine kinase